MKELKNFLFNKSNLFLVLLLFVSSVSYAQRPTWSMKPKYYHEWRLGYGTTHKENGMDTYCGRALMGTIHGVKFNEYLQAGVGVDGVMFTHYYPDCAIRWALNTYVDVRGFYPVNNKFKAFVDLGLGATSTLNASEGTPGGENSTGFFCQFGPGLQYKKFTLSLGLHHSGKNVNTFYSTLGFTF